MRRFTTLAAAITIATLGLNLVMAEDAAPVEKVKKQKAPRVKKEKVEKAVVELQELTLSGTIVKNVKEGKDGKPDRVSYALKITDGAKIRLPAPKAPKKNQDAPPAIDLDSCVGRTVTMTCMGLEKKKGEKTRITVRAITSIDASGPAEIE